MRVVTAVEILDCGCFLVDERLERTAQIDDDLQHSRVVDADSELVWVPNFVCFEHME